MTFLKVDKWLTQSLGGLQKQAQDQGSSMETQNYTAEPPWWKNHFILSSHHHSLQPLLPWAPMTQSPLKTTCLWTWKPHVFEPSAAKWLPPTKRKLLASECNPVLVCLIRWTHVRVPYLHRKLVKVFWIVPCRDRIHRMGNHKNIRRISEIHSILTIPTKWAMCTAPSSYQPSVRIE